MSFVFGKDISYTFYALEDNQYADLSAVDAPEGIYIYKSSNKPSREEAAAGTDNGGLVESISEWSDTADGEGKAFTIAAIDDPDVGSTLSSYSYWLAINWKYASDEQQQTIVRALPLRRTDAHHKIASVTADDLAAVYPEIATYFSVSKREDAIRLAVTRTRIDLNSKGFEWSELWRPDELQTAISFRAASQLMLSQVHDDGDQWHTRFVEYRGTYSSIIKSLKIEFDSDKDGEPDSEERPRSSIRIMR